MPSSPSPPSLTVNGCTDSRVLFLIGGKYLLDGSNSGKPVYKKEGLTMYIYYNTYDEELSGWWLGEEVAGKTAEAYAPADETFTMPPQAGWKVPWRGKVDEGMRLDYVLPQRPDLDLWSTRHSDSGSAEGHEDSSVTTLLAQMMQEIMRLRAEMDDLKNERSPAPGRTSMKLDIFKQRTELESVMSQLRSSGLDEIHTFRSSVETAKDELEQLRSSRGNKQSLKVFEPLYLFLEDGASGSELKDWWTALEQPEASRRSLLLAVNEVRDAIRLGGKQQDLKAAAANRDRLRAAHVGHLLFGLKALLEKVNCGEGLPQLEVLIGQAGETVEKAKNTINVALQAASDIGAEIGNELEDWRADAAAAAKAWEKYLKACDSSAEIAATESAAQCFESTVTTRRWLVCETAPSTWSVQFRWMEQDPDQDETATIKLNFTALQKAMEKEQQFWDGLDPTGTCPVHQMLQAALVLQYAEMSRLFELQTIEKVWHDLSSELEVEKRLLQRSGDALQEVLKAMRRALDESEEAHEAAESASKKLERAKRREEPTEEAEQEVKEARRNAREKDQLLSKQLGAVGALIHDFPEVAEDSSMRRVGHSLPRELMKVWKGCMSLDSFDSHMVHGTHRHPVYRVEAGGESFALKEYTIDEETLRVCTKEAALLVRLRHPNIAEITAVFTDAGKRKLYLQMPWYKEGTLKDWVDNRKPPPGSICRALSQVLGALSYIHNLGVVHCDVKPENIFIDEEGVAYLGDMDVSIDTATRRSTVHQATVHRTTQQRSVGYTPGFDAPELLRIGATVKTDMFAFGATVREVLPDDELALQLVERLKAEDPEQRPTTKEALRDAFFAQFVKDVPQERSDCCLCFERKPLEKGATCNQSHYTCAECLSQHVAAYLDTVSESTVRLEQHRGRGGRIACPACLDPSQEASVYTDEQLRCVEGSVFARYTAAKDEAAEHRHWVQFNDRLQEEVRRVRAEFQEQLDRVRQGQQQTLRLKAEEEALAEVLRRNFPNARQCPLCHLGPVDHMACDNLAYHHGEVMRGARVPVNNSCQRPGCGFRAQHISQWAAWNGQMPQ